MYTFFKFFCVGVLNTALDFLVLNTCIFFFGTGAHGELFIVFKSISFLTAVVNSYALNKWWVFAQGSALSIKEPMLFFIISCVGFWVNVSIAFAMFTLFVKIVSPQFAANIGALTGTFVVFAWNFIGYRFLVFKPTKEKGYE